MIDHKSKFKNGESLYEVTNSVDTKSNNFILKAQRIGDVDIEIDTSIPQSLVSEVNKLKIETHPNVYPIVSNKIWLGDYIYFIETKDLLFVVPNEGIEKIIDNKLSGEYVNFESFIKLQKEHKSLHFRPIKDEKFLVGCPYCSKNYKFPKFS